MKRKFISFLMIIIVFAAAESVCYGELATQNSQVVFTKEVKTGDESVLPDGSVRGIFYYGDCYWTVCMQLNDSDNVRTTLQKTKPGLVEQDMDEGIGSEYEAAAYLDGKLVIVDIIKSVTITDEEGNVCGYSAGGVRSADFTITAYDQSGKIYEADYYNSLNPRTNNPYDDYFKLYTAFVIEGGE